MERIKESMLRARLQREALQAQERVVSNDAPRRERRRSWQPFDGNSQLVWLAGGMILGAAVVSLALLWRSDLPRAERGTATGPVSSAAAEHARMVRETGDSLELLGRELQQLTDSITALESRVVQLGQEVDAPAGGGQVASAVQTAEPVAASEPPVPAADPVEQAGVSPGATGSTHRVARTEAPAPAGMSVEQAGASPGGPWVINLASLPDRASVDRFTHKADSRGIATATQQVTVRGRDYWRVQVPGFPSSAAAVAASAGIKEKLGLKDVWVSKH